MKTDRAAKDAQHRMIEAMREIHLELRSSLSRLADIRDDEFTHVIEDRDEDETVGDHLVMDAGSAVEEPLREAASAALKAIETYRLIFEY